MGLAARAAVLSQLEPIDHRLAKGIAAGG